MIGERARVVADGGWGIWRKAFAYDLFKGEIWRRSRSSGVVRYGKTPSGDDDTRPLSLRYRIQWTGEIKPRNGAPKLVLTPGAVYDLAPVYSQPDATPNVPRSYRAAYLLPRNGSCSIQAYLNEPPKAQVLKLHQWLLGQPGQGLLFQIRNGKPEVGFLSVEFNTGDLATLHTLWAIDSPSIGQRNQIEQLENKLFDGTFETLNFERSTGKSDWYNNLWTVSFIVEPRGYLHIVLEGGDATAKENKAILETGEAGTFWDATPIDFMCAGGSWWGRVGVVLFNSQGTVEFGPHREGYYYAETIIGNGTQVSRNFNTDADGEKTFVSAEPFVYPNMIDFGIRVTLSTANPFYAPFLYAVSIRTPAGESDADNDFDDPEFDTDKMYTPANPNSPRLKGPVILDIVPSFDGETNKRTATVRVMDPGGLFSADKALPMNSVARLTIDDEPFMNGAIITSIEREGMKSLADTSSIFTAGPGSEFTLKLEDGWYLLSEYDCDTPPIGDWLHLGAYLRLILKTAGFRPWQMEGVNPNDGPIIRGAPLGKEWSCRPDHQVKCIDAFRAALESYGFGYRAYFDRFGVWQFKKLNLAPLGTFSSTAAGLSNLTAEGRLKICDPISILIDHANYFNNFVVVGGKDGEITRRMPGSRALLKRERTKTLTNTGLATDNEVQYALRSMEWLYGRGGDRATFETFFHRHKEPGQRFIYDGKVWEVEALTSVSWAQDSARYSVLEVL